MVININDDRMIMEFLSGRYLGTPDGHAVYMNYPLTGALAALYRLCPNVDWYGYFLVTVMAVCIAFVCGRIQKMAEGKKRKLKYVVSALGICTFALGREFFSMTYTTVAAVCGAAALFSYATSDGSGKNIAVTAAFSALTWCIRDELFWMIVPMAGLCWLFYELPQKKKLYRKFMLPAAVFGCVTVCMLCNHFMYSAPEWQEYLHFNELRTEIYDYNDGYYMPSYEEYREYYDRLGLSKAERRMLIYYHFLPIEDEISAETLEQMIEIRADYGINEELPPLRTRLPLKTKEFLIHMADGSYGILFFVGAAGMLLLGIRLFIMKDRKAALISIVYLLTGLGLFWMMELRGRLPERVIYSLSLLLFTMFVCNVLWNRERLAESRAWKQYLTAGVLVLSAIGLSRTVQTIDANRAVIENGKELAVIQDYCRQREKNFYFITADVLSEYGDVLRLSAKNNGQQNFISLGDWISYSPSERERIAQENIESVTEALLTRGDIYLIAERESASLQFVCDYLSERAGETVSAEEVETVTEKAAVYRMK